MDYPVVLPVTDIIAYRIGRSGYLSREDIGPIRTPYTFLSREHRELGHRCQLRVSSPRLSTPELLR